jgi:hypothetical protein
MSKLKPNFRCVAERLGDIRRLHEAEADDEPGERPAERLDADAILGRHARCGFGDQVSTTLCSCSTL